MKRSQQGWMLIVAALAAAALACAAPVGQATPTETATPDVMTPSEPPTRAVTAGLDADTIKPYTITVPAGWTDEHQFDPADPSDTLTLRNGDYKLEISQSPLGGGGGPCFFEGEPSTTSMVLTDGVGIEGASAQYKRGTRNGGLRWVICEQDAEALRFPTRFGYIIYETPNPADPGTLAEMDEMVASLTF